MILWKEASKGTWQKVNEFAEHKASINAVAFGPFEYGLCFASASSDGFVSVRNPYLYGRSDIMLIDFPVQLKR